MSLLTTTDELKLNYQRILDRIQKKAGNRSVTLIAVSKTQPIEKVQALYEMGHRDFGENYVQEVVEKASALSALGISDIRWHFIGRLQRNKVRKVLPVVHTIHTLDSYDLAETLVRIHSEKGEILEHSRIRVFLQVNIDRETQKAGIAPEALSQFVENIRALRPIEVCGLMCIPAERQESPRRPFDALVSLGKQVFGSEPTHYSMGMTHDFEDALAAGATHLRIGSAIFGPRPTAQKAL